MKDAVGQELCIGDCVAYRPPYTRTLCESRIVGFTPKGVRLKKDSEPENLYWEIRRASYIAKIERQSSNVQD